jgi:hypothetical protein
MPGRSPVANLPDRIEVSEVPVDDVRHVDVVEYLASGPLGFAEQVAATVCSPITIGVLIYPCTTTGRARGAAPCGKGSATARD